MKEGYEFITEIFLFRSSQELNHLANQLKRVYSSNKASPSPFDLYLTNLDEEGEIYKTCVAKNVGFAEYIVTREKQGVLDLFRESLAFS